MGVKRWSYYLLDDVFRRPQGDSFIRNSIIWAYMQRCTVWTSLESIRSDSQSSTSESGSRGGFMVGYFCLWDIEMKMQSWKKLIADIENDEELGDGASCYRKRNKGHSCVE